MTIRKSTEKDIYQIMDIFAVARQYMEKNGNQTQWGNGYPGVDLIRSDIVTGNSYVIIEEGEVVGTFTFIIGEEPTYRIIENGNWHRNDTYGTIHRVASNGKKRGIAKMCFEYCSEQIDYLRIDTHKDNLAMQNAITKFGFRECGIIHVKDGSERIAYDYYKPTATN